MHIHILGICGTFMSGIAIIAKQLGYTVTGSDTQVYPPMSTQLAAQGITLIEGYSPELLQFRPDKVIVGNALSRGNSAIEYLLAENIPYTSGPQWLAEEVLHKKWVLAVSGTHGKTTTSSLLAWILESAGLQPGFLIGGIPENFGISARLNKDSPFFVIEADEYDSAFFDKRPKFLHYRPRTLILNNVEYDHADIYPNLAAIKEQFHYLIRTIPRNGLIIGNGQDANVKNILEQGCWTPTEYFNSLNGWHAQLIQADGSVFDVYYQNKKQGTVRWQLIGEHNVNNGLAAIAAAQHVGISVGQSVSALAAFKNVKRRMEMKGERNGITVYDDFAHHPTAIATTLAGLRRKIGNAAKIIAILELGSYTMRTGVHKDRLANALEIANEIHFARPASQDWALEDILCQLHQPAYIHDSVETIIKTVTTRAQKGDHILIMSNTGFKDIHEKLLSALTISLNREK